MKSLGPLLQKKRRRLVGLMSGTSADGVDAAVVEVETLGEPFAGAVSWELQGFVTVPYDDATRNEILGVQRGEGQVLERLTRLHVSLGEQFADAVEQVATVAGYALSEIDAVASHGQTVCHLPGATLQIGCTAVMAERLGLPILADFRSRDVAAGGLGAPLVPLIDHLLFAHAETPRLALNVGGIANITVLPAGAAQRDVFAFDTGPGNMVVDELVFRLSRGAKRMDAGGAQARKGTPDRELCARFLEQPYFRKVPPKAAGREQFGQDFTDAFLAACRERKLSDAAILASAVWLTAASIHDATVRFVLPHTPIREVIVSGGGAHNVALMEHLATLFTDASVVPSDYYGLDVDAKEAVAFALLGHLSLRGEPGNLPRVTGAPRSVVLGNLTPGDRFL